MALRGARGTPLVATPDVNPGWADAKFWVGRPGELLTSAEQVTLLRDGSVLWGTGLVR
jgi:hypothetical protein